MRPFDRFRRDPARREDIPPPSLRSGAVVLSEHFVATVAYGVNENEVVVLEFNAPESFRFAGPDAARPEATPGVYVLTPKGKTGIVNRRRFVIRFEDAVFECVAHDLRWSVQSGPAWNAVIRRHFVCPLTGLPLHDALEHASSALFAGRNELVALGVEIASLMKINDYYGFETGDQYIAAIADVVAKSAAAVGAAAYRIGGDEFLVLSAHLDKELAERLAYSIVGAVRALGLPYEWQGEARAHVAVNAAVLPIRPGDLRDPRELCQRIDELIYKGEVAEGRDFDIVVNEA